MSKDLHIYDRDPYRSNVEHVSFGVYDSQHNLICKVRNKNEAYQTRAEFRKIDYQETGKKKDYFIEELEVPKWRMY